MLRLNASVHSWLTRQEMKMAKLSEKSQQESTNTTIICNDVTTTSTVMNQSIEKGVGPIEECFVDEEMHTQLKDEVGDMYSAWDDADQRYLIFFLFVIYLNLVGFDGGSVCCITNCLCFPPSMVDICV